jgi:hypothetical protein
MNKVIQQYKNLSSQRPVHGVQLKTKTKKPTTTKQERHGGRPRNQIDQATN